MSCRALCWNSAYNFQTKGFFKNLFTCAYCWVSCVFWTCRWIFRKTLCWSFLFANEMWCCEAPLLSWSQRQSWHPRSFLLSLFSVSDQALPETSTKTLWDLTTLSSHSGNSGAVEPAVDFCFTNLPLAPRVQRQILLHLIRWPEGQMGPWELRWPLCTVESVTQLLQASSSGWSDLQHFEEKPDIQAFQWCSPTVDFRN